MMQSLEMREGAKKFSPIIPPPLLAFRIFSRLSSLWSLSPVIERRVYVTRGTLDTMQGAERRGEAVMMKDRKADQRLWVERSYEESVVVVVAFFTHLTPSISFACFSSSFILSHRIPPHIHSSSRCVSVKEKRRDREHG